MRALPVLLLMSSALSAQQVTIFGNPVPMSGVVTSVNGQKGDVSVSGSSSYGTTAGTAAQGNDPRIVNAPSLAATSLQVFAGPVAAKSLGPVFQCDQYPGADASVKINACIAAVVAEGGGTADARAFINGQSMSQTIEVISKVNLLLPHTAQWSWSMTGGTGVGLLQDTGSSIIGSATGGGGNNMLLQAASSSTNMLALYATQASPPGGSSYIYASGFNAQNTVGATFAKGVIYTRNLFDESRFDRIMALNQSGDAWHISNTCCDTVFEDTQAYSAYGAGGGTPLVVEAAVGGLGASFRWNGTVNAAGIGHPNIDIQTGNFQMDFGTLYMEGGSSSTGDAATAFVNIAGTPTVRFLGGASTSGVAKPCFNNAALVKINIGVCGPAFNNGFTLGSPTLAGIITVPGNIYSGTTPTNAGAFQAGDISVSNGASSGEVWLGADGLGNINRSSNGNMYLQNPGAFFVQAAGLLFQNNGTNVFKVDPSAGYITGTLPFISPGYIETLSTPASSSASCTAGQFTDDANYHYVCVASSTWKRVALSAF